MFHEKNVEKNAFEEIEGVNAIFFLKKNIESVCRFKNSCTFAAVIKNGM